MTRHCATTGRYAYLGVQGVDYRVYYEEAGPKDGIPLICQHTAGADGRQWRHLIEDPDVTALYHVVVPDLPYHGKSLPPEDVEWWTQEYKLTQSFFEAFIIAVAHGLELDDPVFLGSSMGGHLAPDLARDHPEEFRAVIGLEGAIDSHGAETMMIEWQKHFRMSNRFKDAFMVTMCAPTSPMRWRRETGWVYSQGAPEVLAGDLNYYFIEHDLNGRLTEIDTSLVAVYLLNGDYDYSASPEAGRRLAEGIEGAHFIAMEGIGHFPMSENYPAFKHYLDPVLAEIAAVPVASAGATR